MSENKTENKWGDREIGALWLNTSKNSGQKFMSGHIKTALEGKIDVVVFPSKDKKSDKSPDFRIYISEKLEGKTSPTRSAQPTATSKKKAEELAVAEDIL